MGIVLGDVFALICCSVAYETRGRWDYRATAALRVCLGKEFLEIR